ASRQRGCEDVTLSRAHAKRTQVHNLLEIFDPLRNHIHAHVACEIDKRLDDSRRVAISADGVHEHLVNLDDIDTELQHIGKTAVTGPYIVDCNADAETLQSGNRLAGFSEVFYWIPLGDFEYDLREFNRRTHKDSAYIPDDLRLAEKLARKVERNPQVRTTPDRRPDFHAHLAHQA